MRKTVNRAFVLSFASVFWAGTANAADSWSGFYVGAGIGVIATMHDASVAQTGLPFLLSDDDLGADAFFGTVQVGYDQQVGSNVVVGVFADGDWSNDASATTNFSTIFSELEQDTTWTVGGRIGFLVNPNTLLYALAGYTENDADLTTALFGTPLSFERDIDMSGWTVGGGLETKLWGGWFLKGEYRYADYGDDTFDGFFAIGPPAVAAGTFTTDIESSSHSIRALVTYKFGQFN